MKLDISNDLRKKIPRVNPGETVRFKLKGIYYDPVLRREVGPNRYSPVNVISVKDGDYAKTVRYVVGTRPLGPDSPKDSQDILGNIEFTRSNFWVVSLNPADDPRHMDAYEFLMVHMDNEDSVGGINPGGSGHMFYLVKEEAEAEEENANFILLNRAMSLIESWSESEIRKYALRTTGSFPDSTRISTLKNRLFKVAKDSPEKILQFSDSFLQENRIEEFAEDEV